jgi:SAM-dependent methyltransferase
MCYHVLEHIHNLIPLMNELHRVLKKNGLFQIRTPLYPHPQAFQDPTHVRCFTGETFKYFHSPDFLWQHCGSTYGIIPFDQLNQHSENSELVANFRK